MNNNNNKRKLMHSTSSPRQQQRFFGQITRQLRSNLPRRRRRQRFSPILLNSTDQVQKNCDANKFSSVYSVKKKICSKNVGAPVESSDCCSCVLSNGISTTNTRNEVVLPEIDDSTKVSKSGISSVSKISIAGTESVNKLNDVVSINSVTFDYRGNDEYEVQSARKENPNKSGNVSVHFVQNAVVPINLECSENFSVNNLAENDVVSINSVNLGKNAVVSFTLECYEIFSNENLDESSQQSYSYSSAYSSSSIYLESSEFDDVSDEYTPSIWYESGSQFSEKSVADGFPSHTFELLNEFRRQFYRSSLIDISECKLIGNDFEDGDVILLGLEDEEYEESYRMLKSRERRQLYLRDYAAEYCSTYYGQLIIEQRLEMVHWIFEHSTNMALQSETMFLGINLLDRFFSKGFFKTKRTLQIAGIACLTLATRIEENQPYNSIRQKTFYVGNTAYTRCEVVAMEWLVQEILNFQCFLPTMYNFLWFYLKAVKANDAVGKTVRYLAMLSMLSHEQMCYWPSTVAASLVIIACKAAETDTHCHLLIESLSREKDDTLPECIKRLEWLVKYC